MNIDGRNVHARKTKWGVINVENEVHCEFNYLRNFLTRTHLQDLIEKTAQSHYENFRTKQLLALKENSGPGQPSAASLHNQRPITPSGNFRSQISPNTSQSQRSFKGY
jgi:septin 3/9/12